MGQGHEGEHRVRRTVTVPTNPRRSSKLRVRREAAQRAKSVTTEMQTNSGEGGHHKGSVSVPVGTSRYTHGFEFSEGNCLRSLSTDGGWGKFFR